MELLLHLEERIIVYYIYYGGNVKIMSIFFETSASVV